jgi:hypothetical protein
VSFALIFFDLAEQFSSQEIPVVSCGRLVCPHLVKVAITLVDLGAGVLSVTELIATVVDTALSQTGSGFRKRDIDH